MLALTKKPRIDSVGEDGRGSLEWRKALQVNDAELPATVLRGARAKEGLTQKQLSERANIPQGHISEMERGKRPIGVTIAKKLGMALNISHKVFL
ncbi:helix-turn-helix domain-containing protein [Desulfatitalea alkaliphila]|uniref:Helix-turn-helix domain-containing protein n=1 Tax=Desulfatitalea alkaliphila TaxID=2929485 RepID=A0AA41UK51_9BACT|nr:helix-turn-helix transcriptional regulator [Desulfatitalea alkaliphila]MCJ8501944.1 helix-turn-helix domain-containing protein [Desulfatitalea alkaliphila]